LKDFIQEEQPIPGTEWKAIVWGGAQGSGITFRKRLRKGEKSAREGCIVVTRSYSQVWFGNKDIYLYERMPRFIELLREKADKGLFTLEGVPMPFKRTSKKSRSSAGAPKRKKKS